MSYLFPVIGILLLIALVFIVLHWYVPVRADEAMIVTGATKEGMKIVKGGGALVIPIIQQKQFLSLRVHTLDIKTPEVYTEQGVPVMVNGVAQIKIKGDTESIMTAAEQFLGKTDDELRMIATETMEGHLRAILGTMTVEEIYKNRDKFATEVQSQAATDLNKMGLQIVSFTIKDVRDNNGYLDALGRPQIASVVKDAEIAEANFMRDQQIAKAQAREEGQKADYVADTNIAEANKEMEVKKAAFKLQQDVKQAEADQAYKLQSAKSLQQVKAEEMQIMIVEREKKIELEQKEITRREKELEATVKKQADANRYAQEQQAEGNQYQIVAQAKADAEKVRLAGLAKADAERAEGNAQAEVIRSKGLAEADAKDKIAEAMKKYGEAAIAEMMIRQFPAIAAAIAQPLSQTDKLVVIDNGSNKGGGAGKVTGYVTDLMAQLPETVEALTGVNLVKMLENFAEKGEKKE
jgi:flotillin